MSIVNNLIVKFTQSSLKSRLMLLTVFISIVIIALASYAQNINSQSSKKNITKSQNILNLSQSLAKINIILQTLDKELYDQVINVDQDYVESIELTYVLLSNEATLMITNALFNKSNPDIQNLNSQILTHTQNLKPLITVFNQTTININKRYPAMSIVTEYLRPLNRKIHSALSLAITDLTHNKKPSKTNNKIKDLFQEIQHTWSEQILSVRLFFSSRTGAYGDIKQTAKNSLIDRDIYLSKTYSLLIELKKISKQHNMGLIQSESVNSISSLIKKYDVQFNNAKIIHSSENWRKDVILLENKIQPELDLIWEEIVNIQIVLGKKSNEILSASQHTSDLISNLIWFTALLTLFVLAVIYFSFEISLRRPIVKVAGALNSEAKGEKVESIGNFYGSEINQLLTAFSNMREQVHTRQTRLQSILDNTLEGIVITNENGIIQSFNNAIQKLSGYTSEDVIEKNIALLLSWTQIENDSSKTTDLLQQDNIGDIIGKKIEMNIIKKDDSILPISLKVNEMFIKEKKYFTAVIEDISERISLIKNLQHQANHDSLTGLYNRHYFNLALEKMVNQHIRGDLNKNALIYLDLDNFKYVNDTMGHLAGDQLIKEVSLLLQDRIRKTDTLGRIGGDEFSILLYHESDVQLELVANSYCHVINSYVFKYEGHVVDITCSIGAAYLDKEIKTKEHLLARADFACHEAKKLGRNQVYIYSEKDDKFVSDMSKDIGWTRRIKEALKNDHFLLACQPIYNTEKNQASYYEILLRMTDEDGKIIMPFGFIPAAERFGLMLDIDTWVIKNSLKLISVQHKFNPDLKLSINLSAHSIDNNYTFNLIEKEIKKHNINPKKLLFEVTETIAIANMTTANELLKNIQSLGCKTALDDFGVGYSSFAYLADLPVDIVKIDGFFVKDMTTKSLNKTMVHAINDIAHELGKTTVAEFVENAEIYSELKKMGVDYSQGYHLGKPEIIYDFTHNISDLFSKR